MKKDTPKLLIIYHASCADGFTAAWVAAMYCHNRGLGPHYDLYYCQYGSPPPDVTGRDVVIVDFSFKYDEMLLMQEQADSIVCLDHHNSVEQRVKDLDFVIFDNDRSGAVLAFDYFVTDTGAGCPDPEDMIGFHLCQHVQDRDLWRWELKGSKEISAAMDLGKMDVMTWTTLASDLQLDPDSVIERGKAILLFKSLWTEQKTKHATLRNIRGFEVPIVNLAVKLQSEVGNMLCDVEDNPPFAGSFFLTQDDDGDEIAVFSLRSTDRGEDVSAIAKTFEYKGRTGGGHRNAAGFSVPLSALYEGLK